MEYYFNGTKSGNDYLFFRECFLSDDRLDRGDGILRTIVFILLALSSIQIVGLTAGLLVGVLLEVSVQEDKSGPILLSLCI